ncbi:MAG TPA: hypothetical protein GX730_04875 [Chloroflexi bacterium]|jgi:type IV secretory pathway VirB10-like protein|nr:hypothetical protein [Chloroflexota bacterium]
MDENNQEWTTVENPSGAEDRWKDAEPQPQAVETPETRQPEVEIPTPQAAEEGWAEAEAQFEEVKAEEGAAAPEAGEDWKDESLNEIKSGFRQISSGLKNAFHKGKNDPKLKEFGDDVKSAVDSLRDDLSDLFKGK